MKDDFDKRLKDRITGVFDNYEEASADAGWALLREKYPEKKKRRGVVWLWMGSAAAVLLLFLAIWIWEKGNVHPKVNTIAKKADRLEKPFVDTLLKSTIKTNTAAIQTRPAATVLSTRPTQKILSNTAIAVQKNPAAVTSGNQSPMITANQPVVSARQNPTVTNEPAKTSVQQNNEQQVIANNIGGGAGSLADTSVKKNIAQNNLPPAKPAGKSPFTENDPVIRKDKSQKTSTDSKLVTFGVYEATYVNYAPGASNQVNMGAGFASDIRIGRNWKLSTGVAVNQASLNFGNHLPETFGPHNLAAAPSLLVSGFTNNSASTSYSFPVLKNYNAQLTALDIPLDFKYEFTPQKNSSFISLGFSSGTFINESYSSLYINNNSITQTVKNVGSFSSFYIAKTFDFSFGLGFPVGKNNLSVEPFVKYPLLGSGTEQIRFGSGGLNLKFDFHNNKK